MSLLFLTEVMIRGELRTGKYRNYSNLKGVSSTISRLIKNPRLNNGEYGRDRGPVMESKMEM